MHTSLFLANGMDRRPFYWTLLLLCRYCVVYNLKLCGSAMWSKSIGTIFPTAFAHFMSPFDNSHPISNFSLLLYLLLSGQCVISSILSPHNTNLKRWTSVKALRQTVPQLSDRSVLQLLVTTQLYLENKGK